MTIHGIVFFIDLTIGMPSVRISFIMIKPIKHFEEKIVKGGYLSKEKAFALTEVSGTDIFEFFASANRIKNHFKGNNVDLCSIVNAKSGLCSEDCSFCAQSSKSKAKIDVYPFLRKEIIIQKAREAKESGAKRFSIVTSGKKISPKYLLKIADIIPEIIEIGLIPCVSLGLLTEKELLQLKSAGLERYHHNLENSERFFPQICRTHSYADKLKTIHAVKSVGLSICSGGVFGMGETWQDRIDMAFLLRDLDVDSVPINFLIPIKGTALENRDVLHPFEALKIISLYRFILPEKDLRICGGRMQVLGEFNSMVFFAGADSLLTGNYLTTSGRDYKDDLRLIEAYGLTTKT